MQLWFCIGLYNWNLSLKVSHKKEGNLQQWLLRIVTNPKLYFQGDSQLCFKTSFRAVIQWGCFSYRLPQKLDFSEATCGVQKQYGVVV